MYNKHLDENAKNNTKKAKIKKNSINVEHFLMVFIPILPQAFVNDDD